MVKESKNCEGCKYHDSWTWVCCNGESENRGDYTNDGCEKYEKVEK